MEYHKAIESLYDLRLFGTKLGLENAHALAKLCGAPEKNLRFIHVAGTNGKGSVCAMLESIYRQAGLKAGLFTSPHLVSFTERIQINRENISEGDVGKLTGMMIDRLGGARENWPFRPTFFEFVTVMALIYFAEQRCDLVVWETGLGGRLDATNIVMPLASVITNVQYDHQQWLGQTLAQIAREKAGIIKPHVPVTTAASGEALEVIRETARAVGAPLRVITESDARSIRYEMSLLGEHQRINAAVAIETVEMLEAQIPVSSEAVRKGLAQTFWPGRLQLFRLGDTDLLMDGAHNPDGARTLARALDSYFSGREVTLVLGLFKDKAWQLMCDILVPKAARVFLAPLESERSADPAEVQSYCEKKWPGLEVRAADSRGSAIDEALAFGFVVIAGSLHLVGEAMQQLGIAPAKANEQALNEWDASARTRNG